MNINLASKLTDYKIDAYGVRQYENPRRSETFLHEIEGVEEEIISILNSMKIEIVSDLLDADMDVILKSGRIDENTLDSVYEAVQNFVEREDVEDIESDDNDLKKGSKTIEVLDEEE